MIMEQVEKNCMICGAQEETADHALLHCNHARACWLLSPLGIRTTELQGDLTTLIWEWIVNWDREAITLMMNLLWTIWKHRWRFLKEGGVLDPTTTVREAIKLISDVNHSDNEGESLSRADDVMVRDNNMGDGMVRINVDGGCRNGVGAAAMVIRDTEGRFVRGKSSLEPTSCVAYMEALAIQMALLEAKRMGLQSIQLMSDAIGIVQAIQDGNMNFPWQARRIVKDVVRLQEEFETCSIKFIRREHNGIADTLVHDTLNSNMPQEWVTCPECIQSFVN